jgi:hypothetical protein
LDFCGESVVRGDELGSDAIAGRVRPRMGRVPNGLPRVPFGGDGHQIALVFGRYLLAPAVRLVHPVVGQLRGLQSGHLNFRVGLIGELIGPRLVIILAGTLL